MHSRCKGVEDDNGLRGLQTFRTCASGSRRVRWWCVLFYFIYFILAQTADSSQHHRAEANPSPSTSHLLLPGSPFDISTNHKCKTSVPSLTIHSPSATRRCRILHPMTPPPPWTMCRYCGVLPCQRANRLLASTANWKHYPAATLVTRLVRVAFSARDRSLLQ